jgi:hypothetical protein
VRTRLNELDRETQGRERRKLGAAPDYIVGSAHAVTDDGEIVIGSGSGSQLGAYAYAGGNVILVIGHQKLVRDLDEGLRRLREYSLPREFARMQAAGFAGIFSRSPGSSTTARRPHRRDPVPEHARLGAGAGTRRPPRPSA